MDEEYFLNRSELFHGNIATRGCYYTAIHWFRSGIYLANMKIIKGGDDLENEKRHQKRLVFCLR